MTTQLPLRGLPAGPARPRPRTTPPGLARVLVDLLPVPLGPVLVLEAHHQAWLLAWHERSRRAGWTGSTWWACDPDGTTTGLALAHRAWTASWPDVELPGRPALVCGTLERIGGLADQVEAALEGATQAVGLLLPLAWASGHELEGACQRWGEPDVFPVVPRPWAHGPPAALYRWRLAETLRALPTWERARWR